MQSATATITQRDIAHATLLGGLVDLVGSFGHVLVVGSSTLSGKRPDLLSGDSYHRIVIWECKTRYVPSERADAWSKYAQDCDMLWMVYPMGTDLSGWHFRGWLATQAISRRMGALLVGDGVFSIAAMPTLLTPKPQNIEHMAKALRRSRELSAPAETVAASN